MTLLEAVDKIQKSHKNSLEILHDEYTDLLFEVTASGNLYINWDSYYKQSTDIIIPLDDKWYINNRDTGERYDIL